MTAEQIVSYGYEFPRQLPTGDWVALQQMFFTVGLFVGLDETGYASRYCYPDVGSALSGLLEWSGLGDPPGPWIKHKGGFIHDRPNPETHAPKFHNIPIVVDAP